ncbi:MAG: InlB B-repeat-containing protein [Clostridiales bacterium]|nr:InlB B-repeat-containing protein [Clostridiales bacterium]
MPISDEIIELEPVRKSKSKLLIMFIIMGVLLALAITFLVLYLLKPNVEEYNGRVNGVVGETSALFVDSESDGNSKYASVGNDYTVFADVSVEGEADPGVNWSWEPFGAITEITHGSVAAEEAAVDTSSDGERATRYFLTFRPSADFADGVTPITITARSMSDVNQRADIVFYIVNQATESIEIQRISHDGGAYSAIAYNDDGEISLPYYSYDDNNKTYAISFRQLGKFNPETGIYSNLTRSENGTDGQPTYKIDISCDKTDTVVSGLRVIDSADGHSDSIRFKLCGSGLATITLTANKYNNFGSPVTVTLKIRAESTETLGYIDAIRIYDRPVDDTDGKFYKENVNKQYTTGNYGSIQASSTLLTLPYNTQGYNRFLQHVVLLPLSIQYNADGTRKAGWESHINVTSSLGDLLSVTQDALKNVLIQTKMYGSKNICTLTVTSTDKLGVTVSSAINVKVVAQNTTGTISVKKENSNTAENINEKISTTQGSSLNISLVYNLTAPKDVDKDTFVSAGYLSNNYTVSMVRVDGETETAVTDFVLTAGNKAVAWDKQQTLDSSMVIAKGGTETAYTGTINFKLAIPNDQEKVPDGEYKFTFAKVGSPTLVNAQENYMDSSWSYTITLKVSARARKAAWDTDEAKKMVELFANGNFAVEEADDHKARLYIQADSGEFPNGFDFKKFVKVTDGEHKITVACSSTTKNLNIVGSTGNQTFSYTGTRNYDENTVQGTAEITAKNNAEETIGVFTVNVYLIDAIESIATESTGIVEYKYSAEDVKDGDINFSTDTIKNTYTYNKTLSRTNDTARDNIELYSRIGADLGKDVAYAKVPNHESNSIEFKYPDVGGVTVFEYKLSNHVLYLRQDLFELSYNNNINATELIVQYNTKPDSRYETEANIKSCTRTYRFIRYADDVAMFTSDSYAEDVRISPISDKFSYDVNMNARGQLFLSAIVNINVKGDDDDVAKLTPVIVKQNDTAHQEIIKKITDVTVFESIYMEKPRAVSVDNFVISDKEDSDKGYSYIGFTAPTITGEELTYSSIVHGGTYGKASKYTLEINVYNRTRQVEEITLYSAYDDGSSIYEELNNLNFGEYGNDHDSPYSKHLFIKVAFEKYEGNDELYTQLAPIVLMFPNANYEIIVTNGGQNTPYSGKQSYELTAPQLVVKDGETQYYYVWTIMVKLGADITETNTSGGTLTVYSQFAAGGDESKHAQDTATITIGTGVESITVGGYSLTAGNNYTTSHTFTLTSATDTGDEFDIPLTIVPYSGTHGNGLIKYDITKLQLALGNVDGLLGVDGIQLTEPKLTLKLNPAAVKTLNGEYVFTLTDTANGANSVFTITVNVIVEADIYAIGHEDAYTITTKGLDQEAAASDKYTVLPDGQIKFNNETPSRQPDDKYKEGVEIKVVSNKDTDDQVDDDLVKVAFNKTAGTFTVSVSNTLLSGTYYLRIAYTNSKSVQIVEYVTLNIKTHSNTIKWLEGDGNVTITGGTSEIIVKNAANEFKFHAGVINRGDVNVRVDTEDGKITYAVYDSDTNRTNGGAKSTVAEVGEHTGNLKVTVPTLTTGTLYLRASYVDASSGKTFCLDVNVTYYVVITSIGIKEGSLDAHTFQSNTIYMYYLSAEAYTTLDLTGKIEVKTPFGSVTPSPEIKVESGNTDYIVASGYLLTAKGAGVTTIKITATDGKEKLDVSYNITVVYVSSTLTFDGSAGGKINIVQDGSVDIVRQVVDNGYYGLDGVFSVTADSDRIKVGAISDNKTANVKLDRDKFTSNEYYTTYTLKATVTYSLKSGSSLNLVGSLASTANYSLTVEATYTPTFKLYNGGELINVESENTISGSNYKIVVDVPGVGDTWYNAGKWTYQASDDNGLVTFGSYSGGEIPVTFDQTKAGVIKLKVIASAYAKTFTSAVQQYTFTYGGNFTTKLQTSTAGSGSYNDFTTKETPTKTLAIDFDGSTAQRVIRYVLDVKNVGGAVSNVDITYVGDGVSAGSVQYNSSDNYYYRDFTLSRVTTLTLGGTFVGGGKVYVADTYTITLTAIAPEFTVNSTREELEADNQNAFQTAQLSVATVSNGFKGAFTAGEVKYTIIAGGNRAEISGNVLTPKPGANATDGAVTVRATIRVTSGVFAGMEFTADKVITIKGVALPTVKAKNSTVIVTDIGNEIDLDNLFEVSGNYTTSKSYTATATGLTQDTDYTLNGNKLTISDNNKTKAGGKIKIQVTVTVTSEINKTQTASGEVEIIITPRAEVGDTLSITGAKATHDIKRAVRVFADDTAGGFFVKSADAYTVEYTIDGTANNGISVSGDKLIISQAVLENKDITLSAKITFAGDSVYKGTVINVTGITVHIYGKNLGEKAITWNNEGKGYEKFTIDDTLVGLGALTSITVTVTTNSGFTGITDNGKTNVTISVDNDFNISQDNAHYEYIKYSAVIVLEGGTEYYCEGSIKVANVNPKLVVTIDGEEIADVANVVEREVFVGDSFNINFAESHGLDIDKVTLPEDIGYGLSYVGGGVDFIFTAADVRTGAENIAFTVTIGGIPFSFKINVTVTAKPDTPAFTVTNTSITLAYVARQGAGQQDQTGIVTSVLIPSSEYVNITPSRFYFSSSGLSQRLKSVSVYGYTAKNTKSSEWKGTVNSSYASVSLTNVSRGYVYYDIEFTFILNSSNSTSFSISTTFTYNTNKTYTYTYSVSRTTSQLNVTYNSNGGTPSSQTRSYDRGTVLGSPTTAPTKTGYTLEGWYSVPNPDPTLDAKHKVVGDNSTAVNVYSSMTVYAAWTLKEDIVVTFNAGEKGTFGSSNTTTISQAYGKAYKLPTNPTRTGYKFAYWSTQEGNGGDTITSSVIVDKDYAHDLYAHWTAESYTVTFDPKDGTLDKLSKSKTVTFDQEYGTLPIPTLEGHSFDGWYLKVNDAAESRIEDDTKVATAEAHTLYAKWTAIKDIVVTFNANGGQFAGGTVTKTENHTYGENYKLPTAPTRTGYTFAGWVDGEGKTVTGSTAVKNTKAHMLFATWTAVSVGVTFDAGDGSFGDVNKKEISQTYDDNYKLPTEPTRTGYTFAGWIDSNGNIVTANIKVTNPEEHTLTAKWEAKSANITLTLYDSTTEQITRKYGEAYNLPTPTRVGYTFKHWYVSGDNQKNAFTTANVGEEAFGEQALTLVADWTANTYYVVLDYGYDRDGGRVVVQNVTFDGNYGISDPSRTGYEFKGWYTQSTFEEGSKFTKEKVGEEVLKGMLLYAKWEPVDVTITLDADGGTLAPEEATITRKFGEKYNLPEPTYDGHEFEYWYVEGDEHQTPFEYDNVGEEALVKDGLKLVAKWKDASAD